MPELQIASVDFGAHRVRVLAGHLAADGVLVVLGIGLVESRGMTSGVITDMRSAVESVRQAVELASNMAEQPIEHVAVSISGQHICSMNSTGEISLGAGAGAIGTTVTEEHVSQVLSSARSIQLPIDKCLLHTIPQAFQLDGKQIDDPVGLSGHRLSVEAHLVFGGITSRNNLLDVMERAGLKVTRLVYSPLADALVTLKPEDIKRGVALMNIGAGTSESVYFWKGGIRHSLVTRYAGNHVTRDVAMLMKTTITESEELIRSRGTVAENAQEEELSAMHVQGTGRLRISRKGMSTVIEARVSEILKTVADEARKMHATDELGAGLVLTGGSARLSGLPNLAGRVTQLSSRCGSASCFRGPGETLSSPDFATGIGLLAMQARDHEGFDPSSVPMLASLRFYEDGSACPSGQKGIIKRLFKGRRR